MLEFIIKYILTVPKLCVLIEYFSIFTWQFQEGILMTEYQILASYIFFSSPDSPSLIYTIWMDLKEGIIMMMVALSVKLHLTFKQ